MSESSAIEWTEATWNPVTGCDRISPGCDHCYALTLSARLKRMGQAAYQRDGDPRTSGPGFGLTLHPARLEQPMRWRRPRMVFVNSMSDLFHKDVPLEFIGAGLRRHGRAPAAHVPGAHEAARADGARLGRTTERDAVPLANVWLGVVDREPTLTSGAPITCGDAPTAVRFISAEPLLGPLDELNLDGIDWLIAGGESGRGLRCMDPEWVRELRNRCAASRCCVLLQAVGRHSAEVQRPRVRRPDLG